MSAIEDTLRHQLQPKTSSHYPYQQYSHLSQTTVPSGSPIASANGLIDLRQGGTEISPAFDNQTSRISNARLTGEADDNVKVGGFRGPTGGSSGPSAGNRKLTITRNRSPTGTSPATKTRKASAGEFLININILIYKLNNRGT